MNCVCADCGRKDYQLCKDCDLCLVDCCRCEPGEERDSVAEETREDCDRKSEEEYRPEDELGRDGVCGSCGGFRGDFGGKFSDGLEKEY